MILYRLEYLGYQGIKELHADLLIMTGFVGDRSESGIVIKILERKRGVIRTAYDEKVQFLMVDDMKAICQI